VKEKNNPKSIDFLYGVVVLLISAVLWFWMIPTQIKTRKAYFADAAMIPRFAVVVMVIMSVLLIWLSCRKKSMEEIKALFSPSSYSLNTKVLIKQLVFLVLMFVYINLIPVTGFVIATVPFTFIFLHLFGSKAALKNLLIAAAFSLIAYLLFTYAFRVNLPSGWLGF